MLENKSFLTLLAPSNFALVADVNPWFTVEYEVRPCFSCLQYRFHMHFLDRRKSHHWEAKSCLATTYPHRMTPAKSRFICGAFHADHRIQKVPGSHGHGGPSVWTCPSL